MFKLPSLLRYRAVKPQPVRILWSFVCQHSSGRSRLSDVVHDVAVALKVSAHSNPAWTEPGPTIHLHKVNQSVFKILSTHERYPPPATPPHHSPAQSVSQCQCQCPLVERRLISCRKTPCSLRSVKTHKEDNSHQLSEVNGTRATGLIHGRALKVKVSKHSRLERKGDIFGKETLIV